MWTQRLLYYPIPHPWTFRFPIVIMCDDPMELLYQILLVSIRHILGVGDIAWNRCDPHLVNFSLVYSPITLCPTPLFTDPIVLLFKPPSFNSAECGVMWSPMPHRYPLLPSVCVRPDLLPSPGDTFGDGPSHCPHLLFTTTYTFGGITYRRCVGTVGEWWLFRSELDENY